jgi:hypothetical protein
MVAVRFFGNSARTKVVLGLQGCAMNAPTKSPASMMQFFWVYFFS